MHITDTTLKTCPVDHAGCTAPTLQHELDHIDHTDQEPIYLR